MTRSRRILAVIAGLLAVGAAAGALTGAAVASLIVLVGDGPRHAFEPLVLGIGAAYGAPLGALLLPLSGWLLMRHVPLGRALLGTVVGTVVGGLAGWFAPVGVDEVFRSLIGAMAGFALAVLVLRRSAARARREAADRAV